MANKFEAFDGEKVAIIHDSASSMPDEYRTGYPGLVEVPLKINIDTDEGISTIFDNPFESDEEKAEFLRHLNAGQVTTSMPTTEDFIETGEAVLETGITEMVMIDMTKGTKGPQMSGTIDSARSAAEVLKNKYKAKVEVFDSKTVSIGQGLLIAQADQENKEGKFDTAKQLVNRVEELSKGLYLAQAFSDLERLRKGGRMGRVASIASVVGGAFNIIPIIGIDEDGDLKAIKKRPGWNQAHKAIVEYVAEGVASHDPKGKLGNVAVRLGFVHFESDQIVDLRAKAMKRVQQETDSDEVKSGKFRLATNTSGQQLEILDFIEHRTTAAHSGIGVDGFGALVIPEQRTS
ncbi:MAG: DegV family EDD domain-containing protein [Candidatus Saccharibacteria bacterium]|nr:DegV family EDD domain-containing protein [Candidatus Saccharibacteria bacterium]